MEAKGYGVNGTPGQIVCRSGQIGTLEAVCTDLLSTLYLKFREKSANELIGHGVEDLPTGFGKICLGGKYFNTLVVNKSRMILHTSSEAEIQTAV